MLTYADVTYADVCRHMLTYADAAGRALPDGTGRLLAHRFFTTNYLLDPPVLIEAFEMALRSERCGSSSSGGRYSVSLALLVQKYKY